MRARAALAVLPGLALLALSACANEDGLRPYAVVRRADVWQAVISDGDRDRLARLAEAWEQAQADIAGAGADAALAAIGPAAQPAGMANPALPVAGDYQCRVVHLGWRQGAPRTPPPVQAGEWAACRLVADGIVLRLETAPAPRQLFGTLYPDVDRLIFLGTVKLAGEMGRLRYGEDAARDQLGVLQAVAPGHWRIAMPWPQWTARLVLLEIRQPAA